MHHETLPRDSPRFDTRAGCGLQTSTRRVPIQVCLGLTPLLRTEFAIAPIGMVDDEKVATHISSLMTKIQVDVIRTNIAVSSRTTVKISRVPRNPHLNRKSGVVDRERTCQS